MYRSGLWTRVYAGAAVMTCVALGVAGCSSSDDSKKKSDATKAPAGLEQYYSQNLDWKDCLKEKDPGFSTGVEVYDEGVLDSLECAWLTVPMDYSDPSGETIKIAVARSVAKNSKGSVVINPGGPGASGVELVQGVKAAGGKKLVDSLDIVGFDPRGVGRSQAVDCLDDDEMDAYRATDFEDSDEGLAQAQAAAAAFGEACLEKTGPLLAHVDTVSAARDMDVLRAALREDTLTYLGISYGTQLGATYAALFPEKAGRLVLDAAVDMTVTRGEQNAIQAGGFESALRAYVEDCLTGGASSTKDPGMGLGDLECPLSGSVDEAMAQIVVMIDQAGVEPMPSQTPEMFAGPNSHQSDRLVTRGLALAGVITPLYNEGNWFFLTLSLKMAIEDHNGFGLLILADGQSSRCDGLTNCAEEDGYFSNMQEAIVAVRCADDRSTDDQQTRDSWNEKIMEVAPSLGKYFTDQGVDSCADWPTPVVGPLPSYAAKGAPPIVVIGTTNDPATPYSWAQALADILDSGVLVTNEGEGHGGYLGGKGCIQTAVDDFLVDGKAPKDGLTC
ncbi:MAG: alpha/beta hydrolase [Micrococcales bacterium]|nr:alpha/beta hydrolase [Micrococcales bacterium]